MVDFGCSVPRVKSNNGPKLVLGSGVANFVSSELGSLRNLVFSLVRGPFLESGASRATFESLNMLSQN